MALSSNGATRSRHRPLRKDIETLKDISRVVLKIIRRLLRWYLHRQTRQAALEAIDPPQMP